MSNPDTTKITFHRWDGTWVPTFKKDGTFDGWKWVAKRVKREKV